MATSKVNAEYNEINENRWLISILNTGAKSGGHSILVLEGIERVATSVFPQPFIIQYDIRAVADTADDSSFGNHKGHISEIRIFDSRDPLSRERDYTPFPSRSDYCEDIDRARAMMASIAKDKREIEQEGKHVPYQFFGEKGLFSQRGAGQNCTGWCIDKMVIAGIDVHGLTKPKIAASSLSRCVIL